MNVTNVYVLPAELQSALLFLFVQNGPIQLSIEAHLSENPDHLPPLLDMLFQTVAFQIFQKTTCTKMERVACKISVVI